MNHKSSMRPVTEITIGFAATCIVHMYIVSTVIIHLYNYIYVHVHLYPVQGAYYQSGMLIDKNARNSL